MKTPLLSFSLSLAFGLLNLHAGSAATSDSVKIPDAPPGASASAAPSVISFSTRNGETFTDVEVKSYVEGVSLIWRDGVSGGVVMLEDLPSDLQQTFAYDPAKTAEYETQENAKMLRYQMETEEAGRKQAAANAEFQRQWLSAKPYGSLAGLNYASLAARRFNRANSAYARNYARAYARQHPRHLRRR